MGWLFGKKSPQFTISNYDREYVENNLYWLLRYMYVAEEYKFRLHLPNEEEFPEHSGDPKTNLIALVNQLSAMLGLKEQVTISVFNKQSLEWETWRIGATVSGEAAPVIQVREELFRYRAHLIASIALDLSAIKLSPNFGPDDDMGNYPEVHATFHGFGILILCAYSRISVMLYNQPWLSAHLHLYHMSLLCRLFNADHTAARPYLDDDAYEFLDRMVKEHASSDHFLEVKRECFRVMRLAPLHKKAADSPIYSEEAISAYTKLIAEEGKSAFLLNNRGYGYLLNQKWPEALQDFNACVELDPYHAFAFNNRAYCRLMTGDLKGALKDIDVSATLDPHNSFNHRNLGIYFLFSQQPEVALKHMQSAFGKDPKTEHIHFWLGKTYFALSNLEEAKKQFDLSRSKPELPAPEYPL